MEEIGDPKDLDKRCTTYKRALPPRSPLSSKKESLLNSWRRTVNLRRPDRARDEGTTGLKRLDDTRCTTYKPRLLPTHPPTIVRGYLVFFQGGVEGYLANKKTAIPLALPPGPSHRPTVGSEEREIEPAPHCGRVLIVGLVGCQRGMVQLCQP